MKMKKFFAGVAASAMLICSLNICAYSDGTVDTVECEVTYDVSNSWFNSSDEWGQSIFQSWGEEIVVESAYVTMADGTVVDVDSIHIRGNETNSMITIIGDGAVVDDYSQVTSITYVISCDPDVYEYYEINGGIGVNSDSTGWYIINWSNGTDDEISTEFSSVNGTCGDNLTWSLDKNGVLTISGTGEMPSTPWADIDISDDITAVVIEEGVTSISDYAFSGCSNLTSVEIPDSVTSIGKRAFGYCSSLADIKIPDSVTAIGDEAFYNCSSLTNIEIPDSVASIGVSAFGYCSSLTNIEIPGSVTSIGNFAFNSCSSLTNIGIPDSVTSIGNGAFYHCSNLTNIEIPDSVTSIGEGAFYYCSSLTATEIPDSVTLIEDYTFTGCSGLTSIEIPDSVTTIGDFAFYGCSDLTNVVMPDAIENMGERVFGNCSGLQDEAGFVIVNGMLYNYYGDETEIEVPDGVIGIETYAFANNDDITSIIIPDSVTYMGDYAFSGCTGLADEDGFVIVNSVLYEYYGDETEIKIPDGVTRISAFAFSSNNNIIVSVELNDGLESIGYGAFSQYYYYGSGTVLEEIIIPASVTSIEGYAIGYTFASDGSSLYYPTKGNGWSAIKAIGPVTIYGYEGTAAEQYVEEYGYFEYDDSQAATFVSLGADDTRLGDASGDGEINYLDAMAVLRYDAELTDLSTAQLAAADVNGDGLVNSLDAILILRYDAGLIESFE